MLRFQPEEMLRTLERHQVRYVATRFGDLDLSFEPAGTRGYEELEDIIRSKETANRDKDRQTLPTLRLLLEKQRSRRTEPS